MPPSSGWNADDAIASCPVRHRWQGTAWRFHKRRYDAVDAAGTHLRSGRYHRARDRFGPEETWPALYLALDRAIAMGEIQRHLTPALLPRLNGYRLTELLFDLVGPIVVCDERARMGLTLDDPCHDVDWSVPQRLAAAALSRGFEAMVVPSATRLGKNLVVFPTRLRAASSITVVGFVEPRLYVERR